KLRHITPGQISIEIFIEIHRDSIPTDYPVILVWQSIPSILVNASIEEANRLGCLRGFDLPADKLAPLRSVLPSPGGSSSWLPLQPTTSIDAARLSISILDPEVELLVTSVYYFNRHGSALYFNTRSLEVCIPRIQLKSQDGQRYLPPNRRKKTGA
ncbi:hypothetical protein OSTOST_08172, partial [Ostertagia ostertagi]